jgi:hypothetical protein
VCEYPEAKDGTPCAGGACLAGACELTGSVLPCTEPGIRNAVAAGGGPYTFDCGGPQTVITGATIRIDNSVILDGEGNLTIDANEAHRVFLVLIDVTAELRGVTVTGGLTNDGGGGILNFGMLTLTNCTVSGNTADFGGGITNSLVTTNGLVAGVLTLRNSRVSGNTAHGGGGGVVNDGTLTLTNTTVSGNTADFGGGITNGLVAGVLTLTNSTVSGNTAEHSGGGISNWDELTLTNTTVSGNEAPQVKGITNGFRGTLTTTNTVVEGDCATESQATTTSGGYNIESPGDTCGFDPDGTDQVGVSAEALNLGPLANNSGPTMTHALLPGSVAIDQIPEADCEVETDQRGEPRPETGGTMCDVGAFEVQP